ncbi:MAG: hemerythrin domain-containing protein [Candidatus Thiodiazotropha sp.]
MHFTTLLIQPPGIDSQLLNLMLAPEKFQVSSAECGLEAWNLILTTQPPDLVILDADMPHSGDIRIGAVQILESMSNRPAWKNTAKLLLTSHQTPTLLQQAKKANIDAVILKPYDPRRFINEVFNILNRLLETHISEVNKQHVRLGTLMKEVITSGKTSSSEKMQRTLNRIPDAIEKHFRYEEQFMSQHNYPAFLEHHKNHGVLLAKARSITNVPGTCKVSMVTEQIDRLKDELFQDIDDDRKYIAFLHQLQAGLALRAA